MRGNELLDKMELIDPVYVEASDAAPPKKKNSLIRWGAMAACFCLIAAAAITALRLLPGANVDSVPASESTLASTEKPEVRPPAELGSVGSSIAAEPTFEPEEPCATEEPSAPNKPVSTEEPSAPTEPSEGAVFYFNEASAVVDAARKYIPGYFTEALTDEELAGILPDMQAAGMTFSGFAGFDGEGTLQDVVLRVDAPFLNGADATVLFSAPLKCYFMDGEVEVSQLFGHDFEVYQFSQWSPDGAIFYYDAFGALNGYPVQISYTSNGASEYQSRSDFMVLSECFTAYRDGKPDLSAIKADVIPEFLDRELTLSEAQADADFGAYMPDAVPAGYAEESVRRYKDQNSDYLSGLWTMGYDQLNWQVSYYSAQDAARLTGIDEAENYDLSLYPIPRADSVPEELREIVDDPIFIAEELTLDAVYARAYKAGESGDSNGWRMSFCVKYGDFLVRIRSKGVEPAWVYQQLIHILEK